MNWNNLSLVVLGLAAFTGAFTVALWISLVIWTFRDMRARTRDAFAQLLAALMVLVLGPLGVLLYLLLRPRESLAEKYERSLEEEALLQDIEERMICPACKQPIEPDFVLCPICHTKLRQPCIHCGRLIHPRWSLCPYCGKEQKTIPGVERAGRVTLLDLEHEETLSVAATPTPVAHQPAFARPLSVQDVETVAPPPEQAPSLAKPDWEELEIEDFEALPQMASSGDDLEVQSETTSDGVETAGTGVQDAPSEGKDQRARNLLSSLFKSG